MCDLILPPRHAETLKHIPKRGDVDFKPGLRPLGLARRLYPERCRQLDMLAELLAGMPESGQQLPREIASQLVFLAREIEKWARASLRDLCEAIDEKSESRKPLQRAHAKELHVGVRESLCSNIEERVKELREVLRELYASCACPPLTITKRRYRAVRASDPEEPPSPPIAPAAPRTAGHPEDNPHAMLQEVGARLRSLHMLFCRPAWLNPLGYWETRCFWLAQTSLRSALSTGLIALDDGRYWSVCARLHDIVNPELRSILERIYRTSDHLQKIFELFFEPERWPQDRNWVMRESAKPYAPAVVNFLNGARNSVLARVNRLFVPCGEAEFPLIVGYELFLDDWIPPGSVPDTAVLPDDAELEQQFLALRAAGYKLKVRDLAPS